MVTLPPGFWGGKTIEIVFHLGEDQALWDNPHVVQIQDGAIPTDHRVFIKAEDLARLTSNHGTVVGQAETRDDSLSRDRSPFIDLILRGDAHFGDRVRSAKAQEIQDWLDEEGLKVDPKWSKTKSKYMTTFIRHPDQQTGGAKRKKGADH